MKVIVSLILVFLSAAFGAVAYQADQDEGNLYRERDSLGLKFGCSDDEYPIPARDATTGVAACYRREGCALWDRPSCLGLMVPPKYLAAWDELEARRSSIATRQGITASIAVLLGYLVVGWQLHSLIIALLLRFMLPKWALLVGLVASVMTLNAVGGVRAIVSLLKLPPRQVEAGKARAA